MPSVELQSSAMNPLIYWWLQWIILYAICWKNVKMRYVNLWGCGCDFSANKLWYMYEYIRVAWTSQHSSLTQTQRSSSYYYYKYLAKDDKKRRSELWREPRSHEIHSWEFITCHFSVWKLVWTVHTLALWPPFLPTMSLSQFSSCKEEKNVLKGHTSEMGFSIFLLKMVSIGFLYTMDVTFSISDSNWGDTCNRNSTPPLSMIEGVAKIAIGNPIFQTFQETLRDLKIMYIHV